MVVVTSLGPPEEGIHHKEEGTTTYVNDKCLGKGTFYISESRVSWVGDAGHKFSLEYPHISLHAISRVRTTALPIFNPLFVSNVHKHHNSNLCYFRLFIRMLQRFRTQKICI